MLLPSMAEPQGVLPYEEDVEIADPEPAGSVTPVETGAQTSWLVTSAIVEGHI